MNPTEVIAEANTQPKIEIPETNKENKKEETSHGEKETVFINSKDVPENIMITARPKTPVIYGRTGILNTSNTCYMNSAIQVFSHNYALTSYLFNSKEQIMDTLLNNARKILKDASAFKLESTRSIIPFKLREIIQDPNYNTEMLKGLIDTEKLRLIDVEKFNGRYQDQDQEYEKAKKEAMKEYDDAKTIIYNNTITGQLTRLLENMWAKNCVVIPTSFRKIFCEARDKFFYGNEQHDAEEAYSCVLQKMQEELAEEKNIKFKVTRQSVNDFLQFKNSITAKIQQTNDIDEKKMLVGVYNQKKREMPEESLIIEAFREMKKYYGSSYSHITKIFCGFLRSSICCPEAGCNYSSNKFEPFLHLQLPMPDLPKGQVGLGEFHRADVGPGKEINIDDCMKEFCKQEILDENNLWLCEGCNKKVRGIKKLELWTTPPFLVIQLKRFGFERRYKDSRRVNYPLDNLDISPMISQIQADPSKCTKYRLQCVINHTGGLNGGHYYTYCLDEDSGRWTEFNDHEVSEIRHEKIVSSAAYLLFYIRHDLMKSP